MTNPILVPRPYQQEALDALDWHVRNKQGNPCVVIPTGGGKSIIMAWAVKYWKDDYEPLRVCILAHRKELVLQNSEELLEAWPEAPVGIYSAGLGRRDEDEPIMYASIDSVHKKGGKFPPFDVIFVDEAHRIPPSGEGKYRTFIKLQQIQNPKLIVAGFTASPYRMNGPLCHKDHILNEICYEAKVYDLIRDGYLCNLWSKRSDIQPDLTNVKRNSGGDYITNSLAKATNKHEVVAAAIRDAVSVIRGQNRKSIIFFCVDVEHCHQVSDELRQYGIHAPHIVGTTPQWERDQVVRNFKEGKLNALCNVNVYTEGFNAKQVDCIVLLRPTLSKGLYSQMVGRGLRPYPEKANCLILDYAHCIDEHGPIDCLDGGVAKLHTCTQCDNVFSRAVKVCPICELEIPKQEIERAEAEEREKRLHEARASNQNILSGEPETVKVDNVTVHRHAKEGKPDSLRVEYRCGLQVYREWVCLDHTGVAGDKAWAWWRKRFGDPVPKVSEAMESIFISGSILEMTESIIVQRRGKYHEITGHNLKRMVKHEQYAS